MSVWMLQSLVAAALLAGATVALEEGARLLRRPQRWSWVVGMVAAVALPALFRIVPAPPAAPSAAGSIDAALLDALLAGAAVSTPATLVDRLAEYAAAADPFLLGAWWAVAIGMVTGLLLTYRRLLKVRAAGSRTEIAGVPARITRSTGPMVVGLRRPEVVVPAWISELPDEQQRLVLHHEWEHVRAGDTRLLMAAALLVAAMPWNVPLWWMRRRLRQAIEVDCDARVLAAGADRRLYGSILIHTAGRPRPAPLLAPALVELPSLLERRIIAMTRSMPAHPRLRLGTAVLLAALLVVAACELSPRGSAPSPTEPTLAEVLDAEEEVEGLVVEEPAPGQTVPVVVLRGDGTGQVIIRRNGQTLRADSIQLRTSPRSLSTGSANPIIFVDGTRAGSLEDVDPSSIESIDVLKGESALERFGPEATDGAILITTRGAGTARTLDAAPAVPATGAPAGSIRAPAAAAAAGAPEPVVVVPEAVAAPSEVTGVGYGTRVRAATAAPAVEEVVAVGYGTVSRARSGVSPQPVAVVPEAATGPVRSPAAAARAQAGEPLILVDGDPVRSLTELRERFEPGQIASITVLKDESATSLYGARGRNGVILVTLKK